MVRLKGKINKEDIIDIIRTEKLCNEDIDSKDKDIEIKISSNKGKRKHSKRGIIPYDVGEILNLKF